MSRIQSNACSNLNQQILNFSTCKRYHRLLTKNDDVISVAKYQFLWVFQELFFGCQVGLHDSVRVLQQHNIFRSTRCARHINTMPFRFSADPVVSRFAINRFNNAINIFLGNSCEKLFGYVMLIVLKLWSNWNHLCWKSFCRLLKMSWRHIVSA